MDDSGRAVPVICTRLREIREMISDGLETDGMEWRVIFHWVMSGMFYWHLGLPLGDDGCK